MKRLSTFFLAALIVLSACAPAARPEQGNVPADSVATGSLVQANHRAADAEDTDYPLLYIKGPIVDVATGQLVQADVYVVEAVQPAVQPANVAQVGVTALDVALPIGKKVPVWIVIQAEGYETWEFRFYPNPSERKIIDATMEIRVKLDPA